MKERKERHELFEKFQKRKWEAFRLELEKNEAKTDEEKTLTKEIAKDTMIPLLKKTYKRKTTTKPTIPWTTYALSGREIQIPHKCLTCNRKMRDANSLKIHLQGKEHKRITKQVKEAQAQTTNTKKRKVRFK